MIKLFDMISIDLELYSKILTTGTIDYFIITKFKNSSTNDEISVSEQNISYSGIGLKLGLGLHL